MCQDQEITGEHLGGGIVGEHLGGGIVGEQLGGGITGEHLGELLLVSTWVRCCW